MRYIVINLPLATQGNNWQKTADVLIAYLQTGWEIHNATSSGYGVVYILRKEEDDGNK